MNVSEIKQEILDLLILNGRKPQTIKSGERVVYLYDALNIVNKEFSKTEQPQLNENQQIVLEWLKNLYGCHYYQPFVAVSLFRHSFWTEKIEENYNQLDRKQQAQVLEVFSRWEQEQEEK